MSSLMYKLSVKEIRKLKSSKVVHVIVEDKIFFFEGNAKIISNNNVSINIRVLNFPEVRKDCIILNYDTDFNANPYVKFYTVRTKYQMINS